MVDHNEASEVPPNFSILRIPDSQHAFVERLNHILYVEVQYPLGPQWTNIHIQPIVPQLFNMHIQSLGSQSSNVHT